MNKKEQKKVFRIYKDILTHAFRRFENGTTKRADVEHLINLMLTDPLVVQYFLPECGRTDYASYIMRDALIANRRFANQFKDLTFARLVKSLVSNWDYLFFCKELPETVSESKSWRDLFDACALVLDVALMSGWYDMSDSSKLLLLSRSLENRTAVNPVIARYLADGEVIAILKSPNGKFYNHYEYDAQSGFSISTAGGFDTFEEAEKTLYAHRPKAVKVG